VNYVLPAGEKIHVIQTPKGLYIRTRQGKIFAVHRNFATEGINSVMESESRNLIGANSTTSLPSLSMVTNCNEESGT